MSNSQTLSNMDFRWVSLEPIYLSDHDQHHSRSSSMREWNWETGTRTIHFLWILHLFQPIWEKQLSLPEELGSSSPKWPQISSRLLT